MLVLHDAGRLVEQLPSFVRSSIQDLLDLTLPDQRIALLSDSGIEKKLLHIPHPHFGSVDQILTLAGAVQPSGNRDLIILNRKKMVRIVKCNRDVGIAHRFSGLRPRKDDVLHRAASEGLGTLLSEHPPDCVGNIALSRTIRSYNSRNAVVELKQDSVCKGFKTLNFKRFQIHRIGFLIIENGRGASHQRPRPDESGSLLLRCKNQKPAG